MNFATQLALPLKFRDETSFDNFYIGENQFVIDYLKLFSDAKVESYIYLWGAVGAGCTHLLEACCQRVLKNDLQVIYLSCSQLISLTPQVLEELELCDLICLDDLDVIAGNAIWEEALFHFYNRIQANRTRLLIAAHQPPLQLGIKLADLLSRLMNGLIFQVHDLNDADKLLALQSRAQIRGLELSDEVGQYLLNHFPRDLVFLFNVLEKLDHASLVAQRKLTIPFVKKVLEI